MADTKKCAHAACNCQVTGKKYCSEWCEDAKHVTEITCQCSHPSCQGEALKA
ncbi:hypothetical protein C7378_0971 [Acidipila rosea]|uniref:Metallothionein n=1 Tax=Acidipila rosea TaxID=768535 RepID=A0A4R1LDZ7_9BACT|nr:hypothetical protein C7378_0971 [Acidipila rosea]